MNSFLIINWQKKAFLDFLFLKSSISTGIQRRDDKARVFFRNHVCYLDTCHLIWHVSKANTKKVLNFIKIYYFSPYCPSWPGFPANSSLPY
jgi:hypothetical protein